MDMVVVLWLMLRKWKCGWGRYPSGADGSDDLPKTCGRIHFVSFCLCSFQSARPSFLSSARVFCDRPCIEFRLILIFVFFCIFRVVTLTWAMGATGIKWIISTVGTKICKHLRQKKAPLAGGLPRYTLLCLVLTHFKTKPQHTYIREAMSVRHFLCLKSRTAGRVSVKSVTNYMPLKVTGNHIFFLYIQY